jgi:hypothetical protein
VRGAEAIESLTIDRTTYQNVKFGPANQGKVTFYHNRGVATVPIQKIPTAYLSLILGPEAQKELERREQERKQAESQPAGLGPNQNLPRPLDPTIVPGSLRDYRQNKEKMAIVNGKLVSADRVIHLTGFLIRVGVEIPTSGKPTEGSVVEIAQKRPGMPVPAPDDTELRPNEWQGTGESVWVVNFVPNMEVGTLGQITVAELETASGRRIVALAREPTFEEWQQLRSK